MGQQLTPPPPLTPPETFTGAERAHPSTPPPQHSEHTQPGETPPNIRLLGDEVPPEPLGSPNPLTGSTDDQQGGGALDTPGPQKRPHPGQEDEHGAERSEETSTKGRRGRKKRVRLAETGEAEPEPPKAGKGRRRAARSSGNKSNS